MSVTINTNTAATIGANNLAASSEMLQKSLNRLSSGSKIQSPADDAGGLAVSMKLSAAATRQGAVNSNIANAVSLLQTQDSTLDSAGKILSRISELKVMDQDVTKSSADRANYQTEFAALQTQLTANAAEKFNGINLFGTNSLNVRATEDGASSIGLQGIDLTGGPAAPLFTDTFTNLSNWTGSGGPSASGGVLTLPSLSSVTSNATFTGPIDINMTVDFSGILNDIRVDFGGVPITSHFDTGVHTLKIALDGAGNASSYLDGSSTGFQTTSGVPTGAQQILLFGGGGIGGVTVQNYSITDPTATATGNVGGVATAGSLSGVDLSTISSAISDVATYRAENGASQSRLGFASDLLTVNKANLEAANSRIVDVDVAKESTSLARFNVLVQAGTAMLSQANQSTQMALKLLQ